MVLLSRSTSARKHHNTAHGTVRRASTKREADDSDTEAEPMLLQILMGDKKVPLIPATVFRPFSMVFLRN